MRFLYVAARARPAASAAFPHIGHEIKEKLRRRRFSPAAKSHMAAGKKYISGL
jgi:hypothetical protein